jgi:23S rRNA (adenine2503-C2)-methyltransferase
MTPVDLLALTSDAFATEAKARLSRGAGRAREVYRHALAVGRFEPEAVGLSGEASEAYRASFRFELPRVVSVREEPTDLGVTAKAILALHDGYEIECVFIPMGRGRHTLCISSEVGCKMGCTFCETARLGLIRKLTVAEILGQLMVARHELGWAFKNVVFMGMGEALDNYEALVTSLHVMNDPGGLAIAQEHVTVCTVGHADGIRRLAAEGFRRLNLSVSLNAANDALRRTLMPIHQRYDLGALQDALATYRPRANFALGVNYCLLPGMNDAREDARDVAAFCGPLGRVLVNVIPYNPGNVPLTRAPTEEEVDRFIAWLREEGLPVRRRVTKGRSVMAACGQLGNAELRAKRRVALPIA